MKFIGLYIKNKGGKGEEIILVFMMKKGKKNEKVYIRNFNVIKINYQNVGGDDMGMDFGRERR